MKLYILRHGETYLNHIRGHFQGQIDTEITYLNAEGVDQGRKCGEDFKARGIVFDKVYCSPQHRAVETAIQVTKWTVDKFVMDDLLKEQNFGIYDGELWEKMPENQYYALMHDASEYTPDPGGESVQDMIGRAALFLKNMMRTPSAGTDERILVSTHGGIVRAVLCLMGVADIHRFWCYPVGNCEWYELTLEGDHYVITDSRITKDLEEN